jgi:uncharacterized protein (TIGR01777 family)
MSGDILTVGEWSFAGSSNHLQERAVSNPKIQRVAISGATGLVGTELTGLLRNAGHSVLGISRSKRTPDTIVWDPAKGVTNPQQLESVDAIVHLAGENIAGARWTPAVKERIRISRVEGTKNLVSALASISKRPTTLVCASAIGFYGNRGDEVLRESSPAGTGYLAEVCQDWERAAMAAEDLGIRVVCIRIGVVLSPKGGALAKMLMPFKLGLGGIIGSGKQYWSWIGLNDLVRAIAFSIEHDSIRGPINAVAPEPLTNLDFTKTVGRALHRPTVFPLPGFMASLVLGEMANDLLLASTRVIPEKLQQSGFKFEQPDLKSCLEYELR